MALDNKTDFPQEGPDKLISHDDRRDFEVERIMSRFNTTYNRMLEILDNRRAEMRALLDDMNRERLFVEKIQEKMKKEREDFQKLHNVTFPFKGH